MKKETPDQLYKYFHDDRIDIFENGTIRYTQPKEFNDPFEALPYIKSLADEETISKSADKIWDKQSAFDETLAKKLAEHPKFQALTQDKKDLVTLFANQKMKHIVPSLLPQMHSFFKNAMSLKGKPGGKMHQTIVEAINDTIGILCLTESFDNLLMWSHYSNSHKGFVVGFDKSHRYFKRSHNKAGLAGYVKNVRYTKNRPEFMFFDSNRSEEENIANWVKNFIWVKSIEWEYENEWRIVNTLRNADSKFDSNGTKVYLFDFPLESIKSVYLGCKMLPEKKKQILSIIKGESRLNHVVVLESSIHEKMYKLNFKKI
jgi:hypothetical protein